MTPSKALVWSECAQAQADSVEMKSRKRPSPAGKPMQGRDETAQHGLHDLDGAKPGHRFAIWIVITITGSMFLIEMVAGYICGSHALRADALDFLQDALAYSLSLAVIGTTLRPRATAAVFRAGVLCVASFCVLTSALYHSFNPELPDAGVMGLLGVLGIIANLGCLAILAPHTGERRLFSIDENKRGPDVLGNAAVVVTAVAVWVFRSPWPDIVIGVAASAKVFWLAFQMMRSAIGLYSASRREP